jgi:hypothetical protein
MKWKWALKLPLTGIEAAGCKEGGGYALCANNHGKSDESGNLYFLNLYLRNPSWTTLWTWAKPASRK